MKNDPALADLAREAAIAAGIEVREAKAVQASEDFSFIASRVVESVEAIGVEHFLVETDSPYLTPHPHRGERNEPSMVRFVVEKIAAVKGLEADYVAAYTKANTIELFGLS